ncbi:MAG: TIGR02217 family protein [Hyphomicrobium sp.]|nr:TIGR02217 family protein [Hyphomicrobium sp.]PPD07238.1 MAG: glycoside hydrolase family 24 [Hyphomicrobium sp.]
MSFHEVRFPTAISRGAQGGPERRTDVVVLGSGHEERNARWADSRRTYNAGYGVKSLDDLHAVVAFFEERRGRLYGFRWRDHFDFRSCPPQQAVTAADQTIGSGTGAITTFQLVKTYGSSFAPWVREIKKPVAGTVRVAVAGVEKTLGTQFTVDAATGVVTFLAGHVPAGGQTVTAGFEFDVPVRFDADRLEISLSGFQHGVIPNIPIVEVRR